MVRILAIDPGLRHTGWGIVEAEANTLRFIACGAVHPPAKLPLSERLQLLHEGLQKVITEYHPHEAALEESFVSMNGQSTLKLGQARGAIQLSLALAGLPPAEYAPRLVKKSVTGSGTADKMQIQAMVKMLLPQSNAASADAADALALAICHAHHRPRHPIT